ncbi:hypothetical protein K469DRAFT_717052 [Zopfia rhizophila CBS 207.26]|uniref:Uncharacterized protein n=1 Tax=Zopfia rhizophila CBS 207.26 TaxID=1314779 RepID=A0A6A6EN75_9PEZI|nr:hypothetical protein K469DRAFT_717052 [Zopfia rhizophila CBS 207.26]
MSTQFSSSDLYLLIRTPTIHALIKDSIGTVEKLVVYNLHVPHALEHDFPDDRIITIKKPYLEMLAENQYNIRADHHRTLWYYGERSSGTVQNDSRFLIPEHVLGRVKGGGNNAV